MEAALLLVATVWTYIAQLDLIALLKTFTPGLMLIGLALGAGMSLFSLAITIATKRLSNKFPALASFDEFVRTTLQPIFSEVTPLDIILIAAASGFCEEVFFRGVLQQQFGLIIASLIFGLFHYGRKYLIYTVWAALAGMLLGASMEWSHSLWVPILAHALNNLLSIGMVRYKIGYERQ